VDFDFSHLLLEKHQHLRQLWLYLMVIVYDVQQDDQQYVHVVYIEQIILRLKNKKKK
jgi:hypothetical protein